jgi:hypothetical protein
MIKVSWGARLYSHTVSSYWRICYHCKSIVLTGACRFFPAVSNFGMLIQCLPCQPFYHSFDNNVTEMWLPAEEKKCGLIEGGRDFSQEQGENEISTHSSRVFWGFLSIGCAVHVCDTHYCYYLQDGITQGVSCTATITVLLFPIWVLIIPDSPIRALGSRDT